MGDVSEERLLNYIYSLGGKVKNADILKEYKPFISHNDLQLRAKYREDFKAIIDRIAVVKSENGEKYLVLKKRYRQQLQDRERSGQMSLACTTLLSEGARTSAMLHSQEGQHFLGTDVEGSYSELKGQRERGGSTPIVWEGPSITITESLSQHDDQEVKRDSIVLRETSTLNSEDTPEPTDGEDEMEKESGSKSDNEEECAGNDVCTSVALDPVEKDWLYSAACAQVSHLTLLLEQEPALVNKKDFTSTALHWAAKHGKEDMARAMLKAGADINTRAGYTPLHIAALHGHRQIMDLLVGTYGAKENLRDYSGHFAHYYISPRDSADEDIELHVPECHTVQVSERKNRKLVSLFHSKKKWGSAEELAPVPEERSTPHQLMIPAFRTRKFSR